MQNSLNDAKAALATAEQLAADLRRHVATLEGRTPFPDLFPGETKDWLAYRQKRARNGQLSPLGVQVVTAMLQARMTDEGVFWRTGISAQTASRIRHRQAVPLPYGIYDQHGRPVQ